MISYNGLWCTRSFMHPVSISFVSCNALSMLCFREKKVFFCFLQCEPFFPFLSFFFPFFLFRVKTRLFSQCHATLFFFFFFHLQSPGVSLIMAPPEFVQSLNLLDKTSHFFFFSLCSVPYEGDRLGKDLHDRCSRASLSLRSGKTH